MSPKHTSTRTPNDSTETITITIPYPNTTSYKNHQIPCSFFYTTAPYTTRQSLRIKKQKPQKVLKNSKR